MKVVSFISAWLLCTVTMLLPQGMSKKCQKIILEANFFNNSFKIYGQTEPQATRSLMEPKVVKGSPTKPNRAKQSQTKSNEAKRGKVGTNVSNWVKCGVARQNGAKHGQTEPKIINLPYRLFGYPLSYTSYLLSFIIP